MSGRTFPATSQLPETLTTKPDIISTRRSNPSACISSSFVHLPKTLFTTSHILPTESACRRPKVSDIFALAFPHCTAMFTFPLASLLGFHHAPQSCYPRPWTQVPIIAPLRTKKCSATKPLKSTSLPPTSASWITAVPSTESEPAPTPQPPD